MGLPSSLSGRLLVGLMPFVIAGIAAMTVYAAVSSFNAQRHGALRELDADARAEAGRVEAFNAAQAARGAQIVADQLNGDTPRDVASRQLEALLRREPGILGTYALYEPEAAAGADADFRGAPGHGKDGRFVPYWNRITGKVVLDPPPDTAGQAFCELPKSTLKPVVIDPYVYDGVLMTSYISPILRGGRFQGIGGVDVGLASIHGSVSAVKVFRTGYAYLVTRDGLWCRRRTPARTAPARLPTSRRSTPARCWTPSRRARRRARPAARRAWTPGPARTW